jgi:hypothetical protein
MCPEGKCFHSTFILFRHSCHVSRQYSTDLTNVRSKETKDHLRIFIGDDELSKTSSSVNVLLQDIVSSDWLPSVVDMD